MQRREFTLILDKLSSFLGSKLYLSIQRKLWSEATAALEYFVSKEESLPRVLVETLYLMDTIS